MRLTPRILGTACVPWTARGEFEEEMFRKMVRRLIQDGLSDLYVFGTAGEGYAVTVRQFRAIAAAFRDEMQKGGGLCQLGVIGLSLPQIHERIEIGLELGYTSFQISFPSWGALNDREMNRFFDDILGTYPQCTFLHYNVRRGLRRLTGKEYGQIAQRHANLVATKSGGNTPAEILELLRHAPEVCHFMTEFDFAMGCLFGRCGLLISLGAMNPQRTRRYFEAALRGDVAAVRAGVMELHRLLEFLLEAVRSGAHMDGAYDKFFVKAAMPEFPLRLLPPYQGAGDDEFAAFMERVRRELPQWLPEAGVGDTL